MWTETSHGNRQGAVLYIGKSSNLRRRLLNERRWVKDVASQVGRRSPVIAGLRMYGAVAYWRYSQDPESAKNHEALLLEYHREISGLSPILTGWDITNDGFVGEARRRVEGFLDRKPTSARQLRDGTCRALKRGGS